MAVYLTGRNESTKKHETHVFYNVDQHVRHQWRSGSEVETTDHTQTEAEDEIHRLVLFGLKQTNTPQQDKLSAILSFMELRLGVYRTSMFLSALTIATVYYEIAVGISEWFEWLAFVSALTVGTLISRLRSVTLPGGFGIHTETVSDQLLYEQQSTAFREQIRGEVLRELMASTPEGTPEKESA